MRLVRRIFLLAAVSISGIALLAPLAARSASAVPAELAEALLPDSGGSTALLDRGQMVGRQVALAAEATGAPEAIDDGALPTPAAAPMEATLHSVATPAPARPAAPAVTYDGDSVWDDLAQCESGGNWAINTGNGYYGGLQFSHPTWHGYGGAEFAEYPHQATREQQITVAERLHAARGYQPWPACRAKLGLP